MPAKTDKKQVKPQPRGKPSKTKEGWMGPLIERTLSMMLGSAEFAQANPDEKLTMVLSTWTAIKEGGKDVDFGSFLRRVIEDERSTGMSNDLRKAARGAGLTDESTFEEIPYFPTNFSSKDNKNKKMTINTDLLTDEQHMKCIASRTCFECYRGMVLSDFVARPWKTLITEMWVSNEKTSFKSWWSPHFKIFLTDLGVDPNMVPDFGKWTLIQGADAHTDTPSEPMRVFDEHGRPDKHSFSAMLNLHPSSVGGDTNVSLGSCFDAAAIAAMISRNISDDDGHSRPDQTYDVEGVSDVKSGCIDIEEMIELSSEIDLGFLEDGGSESAPDGPMPAGVDTGGCLVRARWTPVIVDVPAPDLTSSALAQGKPVLKGRDTNPRPMPMMGQAGQSSWSKFNLPPPGPTPVGFEDQEGRPTTTAALKVSNPADAAQMGGLHDVQFRPGFPPNHGSPPALPEGWTRPPDPYWQGSEEPPVLRQSAHVSYDTLGVRAKCGDFLSCDLSTRPPAYPVEMTKCRRVLMPLGGPDIGTSVVVFIPDEVFAEIGESLVECIPDAFITGDRESLDPKEMRDLVTNLKFRLKTQGSTAEAVVRGVRVPPFKGMTRWHLWHADEVGIQWPMYDVAIPKNTRPTPEELFNIRRTDGPRNEEEHAEMGLCLMNFLIRAEHRQLLAACHFKFKNDFVLYENLRDGIISYDDEDASMARKKLRSIRGGLGRVIALKLTKECGSDDLKAAGLKVGPRGHVTLSKMLKDVMHGGPAQEAPSSREAGYFPVGPRPKDMVVIDEIIAALSNMICTQCRLSTKQCPLNGTDVRLRDPEGNIHKCQADTNEATTDHVLNANCECSKGLGLPAAWRGADVIPTELNGPVMIMTTVRHEEKHKSENYAGLHNGTCEICFPYGPGLAIATIPLTRSILFLIGSTPIETAGLTKKSIRLTDNVVRTSSVGSRHNPLDQNTRRLHYLSWSKAGMQSVVIAVKSASEISADWATFAGVAASLTFRLIVPGETKDGVDIDAGEGIIKTWVESQTLDIPKGSRRTALVAVATAMLKKVRATRCTCEKVAGHDQWSIAASAESRRLGMPPGLMAHGVPLELSKGAYLNKSKNHCNFDFFDPSKGFESSLKVPSIPTGLELSAWLGRFVVEIEEKAEVNYSSKISPTEIYNVLCSINVNPDVTGRLVKRNHSDLPRPEDLCGVYNTLVVIYSNEQGIGMFCACCNEIVCISKGMFDNRVVEAHCNSHCHRAMTAMSSAVAGVRDTRCKLCNDYLTEGVDVFRHIMSPGHINRALKGVQIVTSISLLRCSGCKKTISPKGPWPHLCK